MNTRDIKKELNENMKNTSLITGSASDASDSNNRNSKDLFIQTRNDNTDKIISQSDTDLTALKMYSVNVEKNMKPVEEDEYNLNISTYTYINSYGRSVTTE